MAQRVVDHGDLRKYRTEIPNIVFTLGLSPYELALYCLLKKTAGADGLCWKSTATLARESGMSSGMVSKAKLALQEPVAVFGKPLITVSGEVNKQGGKPKHCITLTDIWPENFRLKGTSSPHEVDPLTCSPRERASSPDEVASSYGEFTSSPHEIKKEPVEEGTLEERTEEEKIQQRAQPRADTRGTRLPDGFCLNSAMREWAAEKAPHVNTDGALAEFCDYWRAIPGRQGKKLDWPATWRNRMRELEARALRNGNSNGSYQQNSQQQRSSGSSFEHHPKSIIR